MSCQEHKTTTQEQKQMEIVWIEPEKFVNKRTWAQMATDDDEEEQEKLREQENKLKNILAARRFLYNIGEYELEEGEIVE
jgi:hypothetical protein